MSDQHDSSDFLETDSEVDEFQQENNAQWEPDAWNGDDSENSDDDDNGSVHRDLAKVPLSTLAKAQKALSISKYDPGESSTTRIENKKTKQVVDARSGKNAPTVMSSKKQVSRVRQVVDLPKTSRRDPRFSNVSAGGVDMHLHSKSYDFIPTLLRDEFTALKQALTSASKAERTCPIQEKQGWTNERERLEKLVAQTRSRIERSERENREREVLSRAKKDEREKRKDGKGAWYMKKGAQRDLLLKSKFEALEDRGGKLAVKKAMDKKRKKIAGKEKKSRPT